jgi:hypothetical protein
VDGAARIDPVVRAEVAEARVRVLSARAARRDDVERLQAVVDALASANNELRERVRELEARLRQVDVKTLVESLVGAADRASGALETHRIAVLHAEIKAALRVSRPGGGLVLASPGIYPAAALSTLRFTARALPPTRAQEARAAAVGAVRAATLAVQAALDAVPVRDRRAAAAAQAAAAALLEAAPTRDAVAGLANAVEPIARRRPRLRSATEGLARSARSLSAAPGAGELDALAAGLTDLAAALPRGRPRG